MSSLIFLNFSARFLSPSQPPLALQIANKIDNSFVNLEHIHRLHRFQIHSRGEISIIIINMHAARWTIANPPDENVAATTNPTLSSTLFRARIRCRY